MNILFYYYKGLGGALANLILLLRTMARLHPEDSIEIVTSPPIPFDELEEMPNIRIRRFSLTGLQEIDRFLLGVFYLPRLARELQADVLWSMNLGPYVRTDPPAVLSVHNPHQCAPWKAAGHLYGTPVQVALLRLFFRRSLRVADGVVVQTRLMESRIRHIRGAPRDVCVAPKAVERAVDVRPEPLPPLLQDALDGGLGRGAFTFLYASAFTPNKNHAVLIRAFSELAHRRDRVRVVLTVRPEDILGAGWPVAPGLIEEGYVVPAGWVAKPHLRSLYAACDACLMPSVLESLSSAHIEAMQWGLPQIAADNVYARDVCGPAALYVRDDDAQAWVEQIVRFMGDEPLRRELIRAGQARMSGFPASWDEASETVHRFLETVCAEHARANPKSSRAGW